MNTQKAFTQNKFVDKIMDLTVPNNPTSQALYMYMLTFVVFVGIFGYAGATWVEVFTAFTYSNLFRGIFMTAIALMVMVGLKQSRNTYLMLRQVNSIKGGKPLVENKKDMLKAFQ